MNASDPSRQETFIPLNDRLPGPAGVQDPSTLDASEQITEAASLSAAALMPSTYVSDTGGPLYRDLQEAAIEVGTAPLHIEGLQVAADATWAWTRSEQLGEILRAALVGGPLPVLPSDKAIRRLARAIALLLLEGATAEAIGLAIGQAVAAASGYQIEPPVVLVREVGIAIKQLGSKAVPGDPGSLEIEIPFPTGGMQLDITSAAIEAVTLATKPSILTTDVRWVAKQTVTPPTEQEPISDTGVFEADDARWYFSGRYPLEGKGFIVEGRYLVDPTKDFRFVPKGALVQFQVQSWNHEVQRNVLNILGPLSPGRDVVYGVYPIGSGGRGRALDDRWLFDPMADFSLLASGSQLDIGGKRYPIEILGGLRGGMVGKAQGPCDTLRLYCCVLHLQTPLPEGMVNYKIMADVKGRSQVKQVIIKRIAR